MAPQRELALFYRSLAQMLEAGVTATRALATAAGPGAGRAIRKAGPELVQRIEDGASLAEAMAADSRVFPRADVRLIAVAETSGRLEVVLRELADFTDQLVRIRRTIWSGLMLPMITLHVAAFVVPLPSMVIGGTLAGYLCSALGVVAGWWLLVGGSVMVVKYAMRSPAGRATVDAVVRPLPILGRAWRELDYWRVASGMEMLTNAGLGVLAALQACATTCRSPRLAAALQQAATVAERDGEPVSAALSQTGEFTAEMISLWATGEQSGRLDEMLKRLARGYADRSQQRLEELGRWLPRLVYFAVSAYLAVEILKLGSNYARLLDSI